MIWLPYQQNGSDDVHGLAVADVGVPMRVGRQDSPEGGNPHPAEAVHVTATKKLASKRQPEHNRNQS